MRRIVIAFAAVLVLALLALPASAAPDGKALYAHKCAMCHGQDGVAKKMAAPSLNFNSAEFKKEATVDSIVKDTKDGKGKMKPMKNLTDEDMKAIAEYIIAMPEKK